MSRWKITGVTVAWIVAATAHATPAYATLITFEYAGEITGVLDNDNLLGGAVNVGTLFSGSFTFESTTPDSLPKDPFTGSYEDALTAISGGIGPLLFSASGALTSEIQIINVDPGVDSDIYTASASGLEALLLIERLDFFFVLGDFDGAALQNDSLLLSPPDFSLIDSTIFQLATESRNVVLIGDITSVIPEPGTLLLFTVGSVVCWCSGCKRNAAARRKSPHANPATTTEPRIVTRPPRIPAGPHKRSATDSPWKSTTARQSV